MTNGVATLDRALMERLTQRTPLRLGTRASRLARAQSSGIADAVRAATGCPVELVDITTEGDVSREHLTQIGGTGVFAAALRRALLDGTVDFAVHSLKDLPTTAEPGLTIAATPVRADARDALIARDGLTLSALPPGSRLGTGSPRRAAQIRALGRGLDVVPIRGNVETRIAMVRDGGMDGVLLAHAGLLRIGRDGEVSEILEPDQVLPAPGQGALAVECRVDDADLVEALAGLDDPHTRAAVTAERALLAALGAGCTAPIGALTQVVEPSGTADRAPELYLRAVVAATDGSSSLRRNGSGPLDLAADLGRQVAEHLIRDGAASVPGVAVVPAAEPPPGHPPDPHDQQTSTPSTDQHRPERAS